MLTAKTKMAVSELGGTAQEAKEERKKRERERERVRSLENASSHSAPEW